MKVQDIQTILHRQVSQLHTKSTTKETIELRLKLERFAKQMRFTKSDLLEIAILIATVDILNSYE